MNINKLYELFLHSSGVSIDTRKIKPGSMFFALKGANFDGNIFASKALEEGAAYAVVDNPEIAKNANYILVSNVLNTLQELATFHRKKLGIPIIAITGTNGKTTTKELAASVLSKKYKITYTQGNLNNHIGVPLTLLSIGLDTEMAVVEMGANHIGEINQLCEIAQPDYGLITNIGKAHLEGFGSIEGIKQTKAELYRFLEKNNGHIFINGENDILLGLIKEKINFSAYGNYENSLANGTITHAEAFLEVNSQIDNKNIHIRTKLIGAYNLENVLAAICVGSYFKVAPDEIKNALENYVPGNNRSQLIEHGSNKIIMDAYNANPTSMHTSIKNFLSLKHPNKILILGDMLELGKDSHNEHQKIVDLIKNESISRIFLVGSNFCQTSINDKITCFPEVTELTKHIQNYPIKDSLCFIKGSRGVKLETILKAF